MARALIDLIVGARPNFVKVAPVHRALTALGNCDLRLIHTGQHYDVNMSDVFFQELGIPNPDVFLGVGSGHHGGAQTGAIIARYEEILLATRPALTLVFGDVNSTMACAIAAVKLGVPVGHVEAGLRSFDRAMPEEINRVVTDHLADLLFTPSRDGDRNLEHEGIPRERVHLVGNVMIDSLVHSRKQIETSDALGRLGLTANGYALVTLHRPSNVDADESLERILLALETIQRRVPLVFPMHPRTRQRLESEAFGPLMARLTNVRVLGPLPYFECLSLASQAKFVLTDSGGLQEETTFLGVPCLTARPNTERPVTVEDGTSVIVGNATATIVREAERILDGGGKRGRIPDLWDGRTASRIATIVEAFVRPDQPAAVAAHGR